jgi:hypothetical protein
MNELYVGTGKGVGAELVRHRRSLGHTVYTISSVDGENNYKVDWKTVNPTDLHRAVKSLPDLDLIFFNQNASALSSKTFLPGNYKALELWQQSKFWQQTYFVSCQLPFMLIHELGKKIQDHTRVGWMLSHLINDHQADYQYADYIGNKYQNYMLMKNFALNHTGNFFGIEPGSLPKSEFVQIINQIDQIFAKDDLNGTVQCLDGTVSSITAQLG